jgi:hypothetical protein
MEDEILKGVGFMRDPDVVSERQGLCGGEGARSRIVAHHPPRVRSVPDLGSGSPR